MVSLGLPGRGLELEVVKSVGDGSAAVVVCSVVVLEQATKVRSHHRPIGSEMQTTVDSPLAAEAAAGVGEEACRPGRPSTNIM